MSKSKVYTTVAYQSSVDSRDPLGLSVNDWIEIGKTASKEAIKSAHAAGVSTAWEGNDGKLYQTNPDGLITECQL